MHERQNNRIVAGGLRHRFVVRSAGQGEKKKRCQESNTSLVNLSRFLAKAFALVASHGALNLLAGPAGPPKRTFTIPMITVTGTGTY